MSPPGAVVSSPQAVYPLPPPREEGALDSLEEWAEGSPLPAGIEFLLTMEDGKEYKRLFAVAGSS